MPPSVKGIDTAEEDACERTTEMETVPAFSWTVCAALANAAVGNAGGGASEAATVIV